MAKVRKKEDGILPGQVTSVLTQEFVVATNTEGFDQTRVKQAFTARKLPSSEEILKLFQHLRQVAGPKNSSVKDSDLFQIILSILKFYWEMAAFPTLTDTNIRLKLKKLLENYRMQQRDKNKTSEAAKVKRTKFEGEIKKLFNIACPDIEKKLSTDRIRKNLNVVEEDLKFYQDQNTERKMTLGALDTSYLARTQAQDMRKRKAETISSVSLPDLVSLVELGEEEDHVDELQETEDFADELEPERKKKKSEFVPLMVPRDILNNSGLVEMMDRGKISDRMGVGLLAATLKSCKTPDGRDVNLNDFTLSRTSVQRKQAEVRQEILQNITKSVKDAALSRLSLHWDGKKLKNSAGETYEAEVILVAGAPDYVEGKILGKFGQLSISHFNYTFTQMWFT